ncbi:exported hypothetical protein [uncultured Paludibacter sp.]|uniref:DUF5683 domain-containing protein n=1 Tax=uncultured Paludibacter sp. TaxID=497635 RepID=A0A653AAG2_9BACT|nr:exported hypothetical protein [uncultured Paludibacter sp.]
MKKHIFFLSILLAGLLNTLKAQDTIVFKSGELKIAKITQINSPELIYKDFSNLEGPDYIVKLSQIKEIHFKNGFVQAYNINDDVEYNDNASIRRKPENEIKPFLIKRLDNYEERSKFYKNVPYHREYGDPYNPWVAGIASYFIPGLGQMVCGETGRGFAFLGGTTASYVVMIIGLSALGNDYYYNDYYSDNYAHKSGKENLYTLLALSGACSTLGVYIWSIVDAVHVAKVNNLYTRDLRRKEQVNIQLFPFIDTNKNTLSLNKMPALGFSLKVDF